MNVEKTIMSVSNFLDTLNEEEIKAVKLMCIEKLNGGKNE